MPHERPVQLRRASGRCHGQKWVAELKTKTGHLLEQWVALLERDGPNETKARHEWLKAKHKLGTNSAWWIVEQAEGRGGTEDSPEAYLEAAAKYVKKQYAGAKRKAAPYL